MAGLTRCDAGAYRALWEEQFGWSSDTDAQLANWRATRDLYRNRTILEDPDRSEIDCALPLPRRALGFEAKIRIAGLQATSSQDYRARLGLLLHPVDASGLAKIVEHFKPRFSPWWRDRRAAIRSATRRAAQDLAGHAAKELIARVARFFRAGLEENGVLHVHLIARPPGGPPVIFAEQIDEYSLVECRLGAPPDRCLDVIAHEIFHYFFASAPAPCHANLIADFMRAADPLALHAYNLFEEALISALANGLVRQRLYPDGFETYAATPYSFYADAEIDRAAKAFLPVVELLLDRGSSIFDTPADEIVRLISGAVGTSLARPAIGLRTHLVAFQAAEFSVVRDHLMTEARARASYSFSSLEDESAHQMLEHHVGLCGVLLVRPDDLRRLGPWNRVVHGIAGAAEVRSPQGSGFLYGVRRSDKAYVYVVVATDVEESLRLIDRLLCAVRPFEGVM